MESSTTKLSRQRSNGQEPADSKGRYGLNSFRQLCIMGTVFVVLMGLLSRSYLESPFQVTLDRSFEPMQVESFPKYQNIIDAADSDQSLKPLKEDEVKVPRSPNEVPFRESAPPVTENGQQYELPLMAENANFGDEIKDRLVVPPVVEGEIHQLQIDKNSMSPIDEQHAEERFSSPPVAPKKQQDDQSTTDSAKVERSSQGEENLIKLLPGDLQQDETPRTSGGDKSMVDLKEPRNSSPAETLGQPVDSATKSNSSVPTGECDLTVGKWVQDPAGPLYRFDQCVVLSGPQNCQTNGRPDHGYESYKWEPDHCSLPRFNAIAFLEMMRGKTLAIIGDSLARNQMESLMCILLQVTEARSKGGRGIHKWYFKSYDFTLIRMWSSWLVRTGGDFPPSEVPEGMTKLNLTELDDYAYHLPSFDVTILSSGHWWVRKTAYFMNGEMLGGMGFKWLPSYGEMKLSNSRAFEIALNTPLHKVGSYPGYKGLTILRTYTPDHYHGGSWDTGGSCTGETKPYEDPPNNVFNEMMRDKQVKAFEFNTQNSRGGIMPNGSKMRLLDIYKILNYRGDGHPGPYRNTDPNKRTTRDAKGHPPPQDCLHWCMPGPIDSVNELLFHLLREEMQ